MTRYQSSTFRIRSLLSLGLAAFFFVSILVLFKATITGQVIYHSAGGEENLTVTFDAQPIPADAIVVARAAGMTSQKPLRAYIDRLPMSILYEGSSAQGYHERITISFESFGMALPVGVHNVSFEITYEGAILDRIMVPVRVRAQDGVRSSQRIVAPRPSGKGQAAYLARVLFVGLAVLSVLIAILIILFHYRIINPPPDLFKTQGAATDEIVLLVKKERAKGHSDPIIMRKLGSVASHDEIVGAFIALDGDKIRSYVKEHAKEGYSQAQIRIALERRHPKDVVDAVFDNRDLLKIARV